MSNGLVEKGNKTLGDMLACCLKERQQDWAECLPFITYAYNTSVQTSTQEVPFFLHNGRDAREPDDVQPPMRNRVISDFQGMFADSWHYARKLALENLQHEQVRQKLYYD